MLQNEFIKWLLFAWGLVMAQMQEIIGVLVIFLVFLALDLITGISASLVEGKKIESRKIRWSFIKTISYLGTFLMTLLIGVAINKMDAVEIIFKTELYFALWTEAVSNLENMVRIAPQFKLWPFLLHMMNFEWVKLVPGLSNYLKKVDERNVTPQPVETDSPKKE